MVNTFELDADDELIMTRGDSLTLRVHILKSSSSEAGVFDNETILGDKFGSSVFIKIIRF